MRYLPLSVFLCTCFLGSAAEAQKTWCGKHYDPSEMSQAQAPPPGGMFSFPTSSRSPLLAFRCSPAVKPYLAEDASSPGSILIDSPVVYSNIQGAKAISLPSGSLSNAGVLGVTVSVDGNILANGSVPLNATAYEISFNLGNLTPQTTPYNLSCEATYSGGSSSTNKQVFSATSALSFMPNPPNGAATKMDLRTGALLAKPASGQGSYEPVFPIGFYTEFAYLASNLTLIDELAAQGFTMVHPIFESTPSETSVNDVFGRIQQNGMYIMYDMRYSYQDAANITAQVNSFKSWPNILSWYTADEPDGSSDPLNATSNAYDLINNLDGYRPVSLVLNCQDYFFTSYAAGADIVMQDVYIVGANVNTSLTFNTPCTPTYGDCGCDNCSPLPAGLNDAVPPVNASYTPLPGNSGIGSFTDISSRVSSYLDRMYALGWERAKAVWTVPQAFGGPSENYWLRSPTGQEWVVNAVLGINHGSLGTVSWSDPTTADIKGNASALALALPSITPYLFNASFVQKNYLVGGADVATWSTTNQTLVLAANTYYVPQLVKWTDLNLTVYATKGGGNSTGNGNGGGSGSGGNNGSGGQSGSTGGGNGSGTPNSLFSSGSTNSSDGFVLDSVGSVALVVFSNAPKSSDASSSSGAWRPLASGGCMMMMVVVVAPVIVSLLFVS